jgi:hypothetical protein
MREYFLRYTYPHLELPGVLILDSDDGKFMNHSDAPNTDFTIFDRAFSIREIHAGEEITCNYAEYDPRFTGFSGHTPHVMPTAFADQGHAFPLAGE